MNTAQKLAAATLLCSAATLSLADGARSETNMTLALANQLAAAAVSACQANGYAVTATVVDRAGDIRAMQRADNAGPHTIAASERKAYTSASAKSATTAMMEGAQKNPGAANLVDIPGFLLLGGGMPVKVGDDGTALIAAAHLGHDGVVRQLIKAGAPLDHVNNLHWTALIEAAVLGDGGPRHQRVVHDLLAAGANAQLTDREGRTPLTLARSRGYAAMVRQLEVAGS